MTFDKKTLQQMIIMMPIILIVGIFGYYKYLLSPFNAKSKLLLGELEQIKKDYRESEARAARLSKLEQEISVLNVEIKAIEKKLPASKDVPNLIRLLSKKMSDNHIIWTRLAPGIETRKEYYIEYTYTIPFQASYHDLAVFLSDIGQMERIFASRFSQLQVKEDEKLGLKVQGDLTLLIYTSKV